MGPWRWLAASAARWTTWRNQASRRRSGVRGVVPPGCPFGATPSGAHPSDRGQRGPHLASADAVPVPRPEVGCPRMERPVRFEHNRWLGDKRTQIVHDVDACQDPVDHRRADGRRDVHLLRSRRAPRGPQPGLPPLSLLRQRRRRRSSATTAVEHRFPSGGNLLAAHLVRPPMRADVTHAPAVVLAHGYPSDVNARGRRRVGAARAGRSDRRRDGLDRHGPRLSWLRRVGGQLLAAGLARRPARRCRSTSSRRSRSAACGWPASARAAPSRSAQRPTNASVRGVAALGAPADFDDWASHPRRLLEHAREVGMIRDPLHPTDFDAWSRELARPAGCR